MKASVVRRVSVFVFVLLSVLTPLAASAPAAAAADLSAAPTGQCKEVTCG